MKALQLFTTPDTGARFSFCRRYRYELWRVWDPDIRPLVFLGMNPSTADEMENDPTCKLMQKRARMYGCGGLWVCNVFAWIETKSQKLPKLLAEGVDIIGPENNSAILQVCRRGAMVVAAWGRPGNLAKRGEWVREYLTGYGINLYAFGINKDGTPVHPLYQKLETKPELWA